MKRCDLDTKTLCLAICHYGAYAWEHLLETFPPKLILAAIGRDSHHKRRYVTWGVAQRRPFLDDAGRQLVTDAGHSRCIRSLFVTDPGCANQPTGVLP